MRRACATVTIAVGLLTAGCGGSEKEPPLAAGAPADASPTTRKATLTSEEQAWLTSLQTYSDEMSQALITLEGITGGEWPASGQGITLELDPRVYDKDSEQFSLFIVSGDVILGCQKKLAKVVPRAPTARTQRTRALVAEACDEFAIALSLFATNVLLHDTLGEADAGKMSGASDGMNEGMHLMQQAGRTLDEER